MTTQADNLTRAAELVKELEAAQDIRREAKKKWIALGEKVGAMGRTVSGIMREQVTINRRLGLIKR